MFFKWKHQHKMRRTSAPLTPWEQEQLRRQKSIEAVSKKRILRPRYDKNLPKMKKKRKQRLKKHEKVLLTIFSLIAVITLYFILPFSRVTSVKINGSYSESKDEILKASDLKYYQSLFVIWPQTSQIEKQIKQRVPAVKAADISYQGSNITIKAAEYPMVGYLKRNDNYYRITASGSVSKQKISQVSGKYPFFYSFHKPRQLKQVAQQIGQLAPEVKQGISEVHFVPTSVDPERVRLYMNDGNQVLAKISTLSDKMKYYPNMAASMDSPGIIDLEVGAYSYPYGKK